MQLFPQLQLYMLSRLVLSGLLPVTAEHAVMAAASPMPMKSTMWCVDLGPSGQLVQGWSGLLQLVISHYLDAPAIGRWFAGEQMWAMGGSAGDRTRAGANCQSECRAPPLHERALFDHKHHKYAHSAAVLHASATSATLSAVPARQLIHLAVGRAACAVLSVLCCCHRSALSQLSICICACFLLLRGLRCCIAWLWHNGHLCFSCVLSVLCCCHRIALSHLSSCTCACFLLLPGLRCRSAWLWLNGRLVLRAAWQSCASQTTVHSHK